MAFESNSAARTALLVMDMQNGIVARYTESNVVVGVRAALGAARTAGVPVLYVRVAFRAGTPEISARNKMFGPMGAEGRVPILGTDATEIHSDVGPRAGEPVLDKLRVSAFSGSALETVLRAGDIEHLVLCGVSTSGVVLSTVREAADKDFRLTVLADACADADEEVHRVLTTKVFPRQAEVLGVAQWRAQLG